MGEVVGYVVLTHKAVLTHRADAGWQPDWDGIMHTSRGVAQEEYAEACDALGDQNVKLCEVRETDA